MNKATANRLGVKHPENSLYQQLKDQVGLCPAQTDKATEIFLEWARVNYDQTRSAGQIIRTVVSATEPAGKPIKHCDTRDVRLTIDHRYDIEILKLHGTPALRRAKVFRLCWEAFEQKGLLSYEDLVSILGCDIKSVQRMVKAIRKQGIVVPTRGTVKDIGRAPSHRESIGRLLCRGRLYTEISAMTGHEESSIERYALVLGQVVYLMDKGAEPNDIRIVCDLPETTLECYMRLFREHNTREFRQHLDTLKRRFESGKRVVGPGQVQRHRPQKDAMQTLQERDFTLAVSRQLQQALDLTPLIADFVASKVTELQAQTFYGLGLIAPGQTVLLVESSDSAPKYSGHSTSNRPLVPVVLSPWTSDKIDIWRRENLTMTQRRALIADAIAREARAQGGTCTVGLLALLLSTSSSALASALASLRLQQEDPTPIKGITEDAGATLTHKGVICDLHDAGYTPPEISTITCHAPESRDRYLKTNLRIQTLVKILGTIPDDVQTARFLGIRRSVAEQYLKRLKRRLIPDTPPQAAADDSHTHSCTVANEAYQ